MPKTKLPVKSDCRAVQIGAPVGCVNCGRCEMERQASVLDDARDYTPDYFEDDDDGSADENDVE